MTSKEFNPTEWVPATPAKKLYQSYLDTISDRYPIFGVRNYEDAIGDFLSPLLPYDGTRCIDDELLSAIATPQSFDRYKDALNDYVQRHRLASWLEHKGSVVFGTDHGQFTDVPVTAEALGHIKFGQRDKTIQVVSKMISVMTLDLGLEEGKFNVVDKLRNISNLGQSVPRLEGTPSTDLRSYRRECNDIWNKTQDNILDDTGTVTVESLIGRHNTESKTGKTLFINEPNVKTFETLNKPQVKVVPLYVHCETFNKHGEYQPADLKFEIFDPINVTDPIKQVKEITQFFRDSTNKTTGSRYNHGVKIRSWNAQKRKRALNSVVRSFRGETIVSAEY